MTDHAEHYDVSTFYAFFPVEEKMLVKHQKALVAAMVATDVKGTIILATEGINATICGQGERLRECLRQVKQILGCEFSERVSASPFQPFGKSKVRVKPTLIKLGAPIHHAENVGKYVLPSEWNALISRPDVIVVDTRNIYETHLGTFKGAVDPNTRNFNQLPEGTVNALSFPKDAPIATFCTGGIRCEKYTAWLIEQGYQEVYHLKGGILSYLEEIPEAESLWEGSCYVFDERIAVKHGLVIDETVSSCAACGHSLTARDLKSPLYHYGEHCSYCDTFPASNEGGSYNESGVAAVGASIA
jgi:UPF0176 protein